MEKLLKGIVAFVLLTVLLKPSFSLADELPLFYKGLRPLGMGGAFTAVANDVNARAWGRTLGSA